MSVLNRMKRTGQIKPKPTAKPEDVDLAAQLQAVIDAAVEKRLGNAPSRPAGDRWQRLAGAVNMPPAPPVHVPPVTSLPAMKPTTRLPDMAAKGPVNVPAIVASVLSRDFGGKVDAVRFDNPANDTFIVARVAERDANGAVARVDFEKGIA